MKEKCMVCGERMDRDHIGQYCVNEGCPAYGKYVKVAS